MCSSLQLIHREVDIIMRVVDMDVMLLSSSTLAVNPAQCCGVQAFCHHAGATPFAAVSGRSAK